MSRWLQASLKKKSNKYQIKTVDGRYLKMMPVEAENEEEAKIICTRMYPNSTLAEFVAEEVK